MVKHVRYVTTEPRLSYACWNQVATVVNVTVQYVTCIYVYYSLEEYAEAAYYLSTFKPQTLADTMKLHAVKTDAGVLCSRQPPVPVTSASQAAAAFHRKDMVS